MNLIFDPWLTFLMKDGSEKKLPMTEISNPEVLDFLLPRPDFQGAAYQFAIGLLQTVFAPKDKYEWHKHYVNPPSESELLGALNKVKHAFNTAGTGPLFMQDFDDLDDINPTPISSLLIDAPGEQARKRNTDHFVKRGFGDVMSPEMANIALFTLQINAPAGGSGIRTGLRGGGPLTTLVMPQTSISSLWEKIWLNVVNRDFWRYPDPDFNSALLFPWLAATRESGKGGSNIFQNDVHPLHMFWAMPRRIRLEIDDSLMTCKVSGLQTNLSISGFRAKNLGGNYIGSWDHPLTPYKWDPKAEDAEQLSIKGSQSGLNYKIWDQLTFTDSSRGQRCAKAIEHFYAISNGFSKTQRAVPQLLVFGYDLDKMKPRGWYSKAMPLFSVPEAQQEEILLQVKQLQEIAADVLWHCRTQIKEAWFSRPGDVKGDVSFVDLSFWQRTETAFYLAVQQLIENAVSTDPFLTPEQAKIWLSAIRSVSTDLFDEFALSELGADRSMSKRIKARHKLTGWLFSKKPTNPICAFMAENNFET
jgi:CRISPR system Cascade subunit CasA